MDLTSDLEVELTLRINFCENDPAKTGGTAFLSLLKGESAVRLALLVRACLKKCDGEKCPAVRAFSLSHSLRANQLDTKAFARKAGVWTCA